MHIVYVVGIAVLSYLWGSICWGYVVAKIAKRADFGRNDLPGAAGTFRQIGPWQGILVGALDTLKGFLAVLAAEKLGLGDSGMIAAGVAAAWSAANHAQPRDADVGAIRAILTRPEQGILLALD